MSRIIDSVVSYRILQLLLTPIEETDAFKLGIIDRKGNRIKYPSTTEEKDSYTFLNKLVFRLKRILDKTPNGTNDIRRFAATTHFVRECIETNNFQNLDSRLNDVLQCLNEDININMEQKTKTKFSKFIVEDAPANNAVSTPGIDGFKPDELPGKKKKKFNIFRRKKF